MLRFFTVANIHILTVKWYHGHAQQLGMSRMGHTNKISAPEVTMSSTCLVKLKGKCHPLLRHSLGDERISFRTVLAGLNWIGYGTHKI